MRYNGIYVATELNQAITTADVLIELQVTVATIQIEIIRMWCSPDTGLTDDVQDIEIYVNDAVATGGTGLTKFEMQGQSDSNSSATLLGGPTVGATPTSLIPDAFHLQQGWLYLPMEEERIRIAGGTAQDNVGFRFISAPAAEITVSYGIVWGEVG